MPELIKNIYNYDSLHNLALDIHSIYPPFSVDEFLKSTLEEPWDNLELKKRIHHISVNLRKYLPADYGEAIGVIDQVVMNYGSWLDGFCGFFPTFVEIYGQDEINWDISINALERYTPYASAEFAVRPFIMNHEERMMEQMYVWSKHENEHVRRLSCEGCRPQLPWGQALTRFKKDPAPIIPILEQLKTDSSLHVRKSVANNINDISKTNPDLIIKLAKEWYGKNEYTDWIVKHGCRTLLKKGNHEILALFGYGDITSIEIKDFALETKLISIGEDMVFSFTILTKEAIKVRLEYRIDFVKANRKRKRKIFQISEILLKKNQEKLYIRKHSFKDLSTRKHYPGIHSIVLIVNGVCVKGFDFEVKA